MDRGRLGYGVVAATVLTLVLAATVPAVGTGPPSPSPLEGALQEDPDNVLLRVHLRPDGSAAWEIEYLILLDDENATRAFESLREDIETNRSRFEAQFEERLRPTVRTAENATGREMAIANVTVSTRRQTIGQEYGVVAYAFEWRGFAAVDGPHIRAGDAIAGLFLDRKTSLRITWPEGYRRIAVDPGPHEEGDRAVVWHGRFDFGGDEPRLVVSSEPTTETADPAPSTGTAGPTRSTGTVDSTPPTDSTGPGTTVAGTTPGAGGANDGRSGMSPSSLAFLAVAVLALVGAVGWLSVRNREEDDAGSVAGSDGDGGEDRPPEELLSNEERVLALLDERGGRIKQQEVAAEFDWTAAKTSQVVSSLREAGEIESFRLGRENVLALPDQDLMNSAGEESEDETEEGEG